jgi:hypothetical protein
MVYASLITFYDSTIRLAERIVAGRFATVRITLCALAIGLFFSFPNFSKSYDESRHTRSWDIILQKRDYPFKDVVPQLNPISHESKLNFRLTVPILAKLLGLGRPGIYTLQLACGVIQLWATACIALRLTNDRVTSLLVTLEVASTWAGTTSFVEYRGIFDGVALLFLACAILSQKPLLAGLSVFLAAWTDERGLIASSCVYLYHAYRQYCGTGSWISACLRRTPMGVILSWVAYFATRFALARAYHLTTTAQGVSAGIIIHQLNILPLGCWTALEGGWLLVFASSLILVQRRQFTFMAAYFLSISIVLAVAMMVYDVTRSMAYAFPAIFIALRILGDSENRRDLRALCTAAFAVSLLWPNYYVEGPMLIWWYVPLPVRVVKWLVG